MKGNRNIILAAAARGAAYAANTMGHITGLDVAKQFILGGNFKTALVIGSERITTVVDWTDRNTCILFGDGAGAVLLGPTESGSTRGGSPLHVTRGGNRSRRPTASRRASTSPRASA